MKQLIITALLLSTNAFAVPYTILLESNKDYNKILVKDTKADVNGEVIQLNPLSSQANQKINKMLLAGITDMIEMGNEEASGNFYIDTQEKVLEVTTDYLTTESNGSWYTGGAHPNSIMTVTTLDLKKAAQVKAEELSSAYISMDDVIAENQKEKAESMMKKLLVKKIATGDCKDEEVTEEILWLGNVALTSQNLIVSSDFPHAMAVCNTSVEIPYAKVKSMLKSGSLAEKLAKAATK